MFQDLSAWLTAKGLTTGSSITLTYLIILSTLLILSFLANLIAKKYILSALSYLIERSKNRWDDVLLEMKVFDRLSHLAPALVIYLGGSFFFYADEHPILHPILDRGSLIYMFLVGALFIDALFNAVQQIYRSYEISKQRPIKGYIQAMKTGLYMLTLILIISILIDESPKLLLSGLGALTAILLLIFKDSILGFVAGIQLASNQMIRQGDWVTVPKADADGDVIDVSLTTVKIQNWDKTITSVPIYWLVSDAFTNWRGMMESGGRRIKRNLAIDMTSIRFCDEEMLDRFEKIKLIAGYIRDRRAAMRDYRHERDLPPDDTINGPQLTNIGTFRQYVSAYLRNHPAIHQDMTFLVRYLEPGPLGLPMQLYVFCNDQRWAYYEQVQADLFDHLLAVIPQFDLRVFQNPSGHDLARAGWFNGRETSAEHPTPARLETTSRDDP